MADQDDYEAKLAKKRADWVREQEEEKRLREQRKKQLLAKHAQEKADREIEETNKQALRQELSESLFTRLSEIVFKYAPVLQKKRFQFVFRDDYGQLCGLDKWSGEVQVFCQSVVASDLVVGELRTRALRQGFTEFFDLVPGVVQLIDKHLESYGRPLESQFDEEMMGADFELYCEQALSESGWSVFRKGGSGDQGVDLVASLGQLRVAVQCKRYSQPVGNKAVQEVAAGRQFEQCDLAVVVTNAEYTSAARQLANALGVQLLHYSDIIGFRDRVTSQFPALVSDREGRS